MTNLDTENLMNYLKFGAAVGLELGLGKGSAAHKEEFENVENEVGRGSTKQTSQQLWQKRSRLILARRNF